MLQQKLQKVTNIFHEYYTLSLYDLYDQTECCQENMEQIQW